MRSGLVRAGRGWAGELVGKAGCAAQTDWP